MKIKFHLSFVFIFFIGAIPLFWHLSSLPIQPYDEARLAVNSLEMYWGKTNIFVTTYGGLPDLWNTKPSLLIWMQVLTMKAIGINEIGIRFPSALAAFCTCLLLFWFCAKKINRPLLGILTVAILITSEGYIRIHGTRTGDYDALLTFFTTAYCIYYYLFVSQKNDKYGYLAFLCMAFAVLTKGIAALLFIPTLLVFTMLFSQHYFIFRSKTFYTGISIFLIIALGYYFLRERINPGYIHAVFENELGGRFNTVLEHHLESKWFYWDETINKGFRYWILMLPFGVITGLQTASRRVKYFTIFASLLVVTHFAVITQAQTKIS